MPRGDRTGPEGAGPMTGRALGYCSGNDQPGYTADAAPQGAARGFRNGAGRGPGYGRGFGRGAGRGRGRRFGFAARGVNYAPNTNTSNLDNEEAKNREITRLENLANTLSSELENVKNQLEKIKNE